MAQRGQHGVMISCEVGAVIPVFKLENRLRQERWRAPRSGRAGFYSQVAFPVDVKSRERQHPGEKPQFCTGRSSHQPSMKKEQERQRDETRGKD